MTKATLRKVIFGSFLVLFLSSILVYTQEIFKKNKKNYAQIHLSFKGFRQDYLVFDLSYRYYLKDNFNIGWKITAANYAIPPKGYEGKSITLGPVWGYDARLKNKSFGLNFNLFLWATVFTDQKKREWIPGLGYERIHLLSKFNYGTDLDFVFYKPLRISRHISICPGAGCFINVSSFSFDELNDAYQIMRTEDLYYELGIILSMPVFINIGKKDFFVVTLQYNYSFFSNILYPHTFINTFLLRFKLKI